MKCKRCGELIKNGNLYCSYCGAEVQIVPEYNEIEDDLIIKINDEFTEMPQEKQPDIQAYAEQAALLSWKRVLAGIFTALAGFCLMLAVSYGLQKNNEMRIEQRVQEEQPYSDVMDALAKQHIDSAIQIFKTARSWDGENLDYLFWLAHLYQENGQKELQADVLNEILKLDRENIYACKLVLENYAEQGQFDELYRLYEHYEESKLAALFREYMVAAPVVETEEPFLSGSKLTITADDGLNIYYTLDGSSPITNGILYYAPIALQAGDYHFLITACNEKGYYSPVESFDCTAAPVYKLEMPNVTPASGEYSVPQTIYVNVPDSYEAYYIWNGGTPTDKSNHYNGGIKMREGNNVLSIIYMDEYGNTSDVQRVNYIYMP